MKKKFNLALIAILVFIGIATIATSSASSNAPGSIQMGNGEQLEGYINGVSFPIKITSDGKYAYCLDKHKQTPANVVMSLSEAKDAGITYIMKNGYPAKSFTGNRNYDYYITQTAVWWYLDDTTGSSNLDSGFKSTGSDSYGLRHYVKELVNAAKDAKNAGYKDPSITISGADFKFSEDQKYYITDDIKITGVNVPGKITVTLIGAPEGATLINSNGGAVSSVNSGETVKIKVPASSISGVLAAMTIQAEAEGRVEKAYQYNPSDSVHQSVVMSTLYYISSPVKVTKVFKLGSASLEVTKVDEDTGKPLAGAKLRLINSDNETVAEWVTTTEAKHFSNLPEGNYTLIELEAPEGYVLSKSVYNIVLKNGNLTKMTFKNSKKAKGEVIIIKRDAATNEVLAGAVLVLKDANGNEVARWTTTTKGHSISGLDEGEYTIEEVSAPKGYIKSNEVRKVTIKSGESITVTYYNHKETIKSVIRILKVDGETGESLAGATMVLKDTEGNVVRTWKTTNEEYVIEDLQNGTYYLSEKEAPKGYVLSDEEIEIVVTENSGTQTFTFNNIPEVEVPNTESNASILAIVAGVVTAIVGAGIIYINVKKEN